MAQTTQFCTFFLNGFFFGVEVLKVQEIIRYQQMTMVPLAPDMIEGLINLRGQIVTAIDLRRRMNFEERAVSAELPMNVVVRTVEGAVSLLVDEMGDVIEVDEASFEPSPATLRGVARDMIRGVYKLKDRLLLILDTERAMKV
jgi:purine-binding chemotaxis protein CheW